MRGDNIWVKSPFTGEKETILCGLTQLMKYISFNITSNFDLLHKIASIGSNTTEPFSSLRPSDAYICVGKLTIIGSDNGLSPGRRQAIIWTNVGILLIRPSGTNFSEIVIGNQIFSFKKIRLKMSSAKCCSLHLGLNVLEETMMWSFDVYSRHGKCFDLSSVHDIVGGNQANLPIIASSTMTCRVLQKTRLVDKAMLNGIG